MYSIDLLPDDDMEDKLLIRKLNARTSFYQRGKPMKMVKVILEDNAEIGKTVSEQLLHWWYVCEEDRPTRLCFFHKPDSDKIRPTPV